MATVDEQPQVPEVGRWRYVGGVERLYMHVPVTVQHGAVIEHAGTPADDGCWEPAEDDAEVTHVPDNTPTEAPVPELLVDDLDVDAEQQQIVYDTNDTAGE